MTTQVLYRYRPWVLILGALLIIAGAAYYWLLGVQRMSLLLWCAGALASAAYAYSWRDHPTCTHHHAWVLVLGTLITSAGVVHYALLGYQRLSLLLWGGGMLVVAVYAFSWRATTDKPLTERRWDVWNVVALVACFAPCYAAYLDTAPLTIHTDEIVVMIAEQRATSDPTGDLFGLSHYFLFPSLIFMVFGWLGKAIGGITLANIRLIHATCGVLIIGLSYWLYRAVMPRRYALGGAAIVGANHALLAISRTALRDNTSVLVETAAFALLLRGLVRRCVSFSFFGGLMAGLSFYTYYPSRVTMPLWLLALLCLAVVRRGAGGREQLAKVAAMSVLGFSMVAGPVLVATAKAPDDGIHYGRQQLLVFAEGRKMQREWTGSPSISAGVHKNIVQGLTTFNNRIEDHGGVYQNWDHGFVDPLTGVLLWLGVMCLLYRHAWRGRDEHVIMLSSFVALWLAFSFVINKSPHYTRLLVTLPFVGYLAAEGLRGVSSSVQRVLQGRGITVAHLLGTGCFALGVCAVVYWNLWLYTGYLQRDFQHGNDVRGTARYVSTRPHLPGHVFYLVTSEVDPYMWWGEAFWQDWFQFFAAEDQQVKVIGPGDVPNPAVGSSYSLLMGKATWARLRHDLTRQAGVSVQSLMPDGSLVAVEVGPPTHS